MAHSPWFIINWPAMYFGTGGLRFVWPARNAWDWARATPYGVPNHRSVINVDNPRKPGGWL